MEQEAVETGHIGTALAFLAVVVFFVLFNLRFGQRILNHTINKVAEQEDSGVSKTFENFFSDDADGGLIVPSAAAYSFVGYNGTHIDRVVCFDSMHTALDIMDRGYGTERDEYGRVGITSYPDTYNDLSDTDVPDVCLKRHMTGYVRMRAVFDKEDGTYILYVYPAAAP